MPLGDQLRLEGVLLRSGTQFVLRVDDGGVWRLESVRSLRRMLGRRVVVTGTRDGFDLVAARSVMLVAPA